MRYEIRVAGVLTGDWARWFAASRVRGETTITCEVPDQAALRGVLDRIGDLGLDLIAVVRIAGDDGDRLTFAPVGGDAHDGEDTSE